MRKKSKIIAGGILITSVIGATSFAIIDPYNIVSNKNVKTPEQGRKLEKSNNKEKEDIDNKKDESNMNLNGIKDGTYLGEAKGYGGNIKVKVTIESEKIKNIEVLSHSETPKYYENGSKVIGNIIKANSTDVDAVSGATLTSNGIKNAVRDALSKAGFNVSKDNNEVSVASNSAKSRSVSSNNMVKNIDLKEYKIKDGEYIGEAIGFKGNVKVKVIISGGKLSDVKVISHNDDAEFFNKAKSVIIKILKNQGTAGVDTVSGATYSSRGIINAVNSALNKVAKESNGIFNTIKIFENDNIPRKDNNPKFNVKDIVKEALHQKSISINKDDNISSREHTFKDGEYIGEANGFKGNVKVKVIIKNGTLVNIEIINHNDDEEFFNNAKRLIFKILKNQGTTGVDTVSGATYSSKGIINSVNRALNKAVNKNITNQDTIVQSKGDKVKENVDIKDIETLNDKITQKENQEISKDRKESSKSVKYLDGSYKVVGIGFTGKPIKSVVTFENNKIKSIDVGTIESGDFGDNSPFRPIAIKVVDHILSDNGGKSINDLILHGEIVDKIFKSNNYYEIGKVLIGDYAGELKEIYASEGRIAHEKISSVVKKYMKAKNNSTVLDSVSGATFSAIGIAKSVKDAMNKSANDYETGNIVNDLKIKTPSEKRMYADFVYSAKDKKLDLSNLKVIISMRDGKEKEISYDKFKENDIEIHDRETGKAITNGMDLSSYESGHGIYATIKHKKSLYTDTLLIIPRFFDKIDTNHLTGMEYSIDNGASWKALSSLEMNEKNINFYQTIKLPKEFKGKDISLRVVSTNKNTYLLKLEKSGQSLKVEKGKYDLITNEEDRLRNHNLRNLYRIVFEFIENADSHKKEKESNKDVKYLDGKYIGIGKGWTSNPIKSEVIFENNKIKSIEVATKESGDYGDDDDYRDKAIKVVNLLKNDPEKTINDILLLDQIAGKIVESGNYYEKGKELIGDYAENLKGVEKNTFLGPRVETYSIVAKYLKEHKEATVFDVVSGATFSAKGIVKSVKDAMDKAANDYKTGNIINNLKIKSPSNKNMRVDKKEKLDLSNLKIVISMRDGKEKEIGYNELKENGIEIYEEETKKTIYNGMDLSSYERNHAISAVIEHKNSLNKDKLIIIPEIIDKNYITGMEYSVDNGVTWKNISDLKKINNSNNIHFNQELKISKEDEGKVLLRAVSINGYKYKLNLKEKIDGPNGYCIFEPSNDDKAKNKHVANGFNISFKFTNTTDNNVATSLEKVSYARIYLNDSVIYKQYQGKLKVGQKIDWTGAKFKFKNSEQESIKDLFTEAEIKNLKNSNSYKKEGYFDYEDLEKLGITISPNQNSEVTTDLNVTLTYKGKTFKVKGGGINGDDDFVGILIEK
ncbi:FMN-binding protein [Clostridium perfringens]|nr:FMN-binding protein [Clostridium perfringens]